MSVGVPLVSCVLGMSRGARISPALLPFAEIRDCAIITWREEGVGKLEGGGHRRK